MIEVTTETTRLEGTKVQLMSEFCCLVHHLVVKGAGENEPILTREELDHCIEMATLSDDELHERSRSVDAALIEILSMLGYVK